MTQGSLPWAAGGGGDESPHSFAQLGRWMESLAAVGSATEGVLRRYLDELAPSAIAGNTQLRVASGAALAAGGKWFENTANHDYTPALPTVAGRPADAPYCSRTRWHRPCASSRCRAQTARARSRRYPLRQSRSPPTR